jgi:hypothetical protein
MREGPALGEKSSQSVVIMRVMRKQGVKPIVRGQSDDVVRKLRVQRLRRKFLEKLQAARIR